MRPNKEVNMPGERKVIFRIRGNATIERASALRDALLKLLADSTVTAVQIEGSEIVHADLSFLQILISACRSYLREAKPLEIVNFPRDVLHLFAISGFRRHLICEACHHDACIFQHMLGEAGK